MGIEPKILGRLARGRGYTGSVMILTCDFMADMDTQACFVFPLFVFR
jgi:hypothetical protein